MRGVTTSVLVLVICCFALLLGVSHGQSGYTPARKSVALPAANRPRTDAPTDRYEYRGMITAQDAVKLATIRQAGRQQDKSQVALMVDSLNKPAHPMYPYTAMHSLSQIGAVEALPAFASYLPKDDGTVLYDDLTNFAHVAKARLLAESSSRSASNSKASADVKVRLFYQELGLTPNDLNVHPIMVSGLPWGRNGGFFATSAPQIRSREGFAMRELADMVYEGDYQDYKSLGGVADVDFSRDYCSSLKMRLAPLARQNRLHVLIQELSHKIVLKNEDDFEIQLAINEGPAASQAAAAELRKMDTHREQYDQVSHHTGFTALLRVIWGVGDQDQVALVEHFTHDSDSSVAHSANIVYRDVKNGIPRQPIWAY